MSNGKSFLVALGVAVAPWATETVLSPLVGVRWGKGIARAFTRCMMKNIYLNGDLTLNIYLSIYLILYIIHLSIFTNPSAQAGYDTRSIFKQSLTGLNSEFSFSLTSCLTKAEEPSLSYYFLKGE